MTRLNEQDTDYLCSAGFLCLGAARLFFKVVYDNLENIMDEAASKRADYRAIKKTNPILAKQLRQEMQKQYFGEEERRRYKFMMKHINDLMGDFEWTESFATLGHLKVKLKPTEFCEIFDNYLQTSNEMARIVLQWSDFVDEHGIIKAESFFKNSTKKQQCGHLAELFKINGTPQA